MATFPIYPKKTIINLGTAQLKSTRSRIGIDRNGLQYIFRDVKYIYAKLLKNIKSVKLVVDNLVFNQSSLDINYLFVNVTAVARLFNDVEHTGQSAYKTFFDRDYSVSSFFHSHTMTCNIDIPTELVDYDYGSPTGNDWTSIRFMVSLEYHKDNSLVQIQPDMYWHLEFENSLIEANDEYINIGKKTVPHIEFGDSSYVRLVRSALSMCNANAFNDGWSGDNCTSISLDGQLMKQGSGFLIEKNDGNYQYSTASCAYRYTKRGATSPTNWITPPNIGFLNPLPTDMDFFKPMDFKVFVISITDSGVTTGPSITISLRRPTEG